MYVCIECSVQGGQKRALYLLELELWAVLIYLAQHWELSSGPLHHQNILSTPEPSFSSSSMKTGCRLDGALEVCLSWQ